MTTALSFTALIILVALIFDVANGWHDAANSIATVVSTRVLSPGVAVAWAAFFNFVAFALFGTRVAQTIGGDLVDIERIAERWIKTISFIFISPLLGMILGMAFMVAIAWIFRRYSPGRVDKLFRRGQLFSAALYSLGHGGADAQKTMGIIAAVLVAGSVNPGATKHIPLWVVLSCHAAMALGTLVGGWRIVHTMGSRITKLKPVGGFAAETAGALTLFMAVRYGIPVSTTHTITGAIIGVGATRRLSAVRWGVARRVVWAWVMTIPCSALMAAICFFIVAALHK